MRYICAAAFITLSLVAQSVHAQDASRVAVNVAAAPAVQAHPFAFEVTRPAGSQRALLLSTYVSYGALQGYDVYSTSQVLKRGGVEANPAMKFATTSSARLFAVKASLSAVTIFTAERLWRKGYRGRAIAAMVLSNGVMGVVAAHNSSVLRQLR